ncbi:MAG: ATP-dependent zinc metalloprotease FtsH [Bacteroidia bacterium]|nr:ATP-dependent zinc metalloprotease FtsH [Bacteroidia bacterium]
MTQKSTFNLADNLNDNQDSDNIQKPDQPNNQGQGPGKIPDNNLFPNKNKKKFNVYWIYGLILAGFFILQFFGNSKQPVKTDWKRFKNDMLLSHDVAKLVVVNGKSLEIYIRDDKLSSDKYKELKEKGLSAPKSGPHYTFNIGSADAFEKRLEDAQKDFPEDQRIYPENEERHDYFSDILPYLMTILIFVGLYMFLIRRMGGNSGGPGGGIFNVGKSRAQIFDKETSVKIDFKDVAGLEEAKIEIREIVEFLKSPKKYTDLGGKIPKGALLIGPPGTGKTLLAKAVAGEAHVPFFSLSGSDFVEMFVGVGASRVRDLFKQAKEKAPCIIFIDEIDAIGRSRGRNANFGANDERENTLNQLLTEMDGFQTNIGVIVLAATNRADILDIALLRAGRFDRQIHVELPDLNERKEIFAVHLKPIKYDKTIDLDFFAKQTPGFSGADIANVCNESALIAARSNKTIVEKQDFLDAIDRIVGGLEKKNKIITVQEKRTIAYHEAGHATASWMLEYANPLVKVTIVPRGKALGAAWYLPEERQITTREQILDDMCATLGGRASEEINFGKISTGALNDLEKVTKQAYAMVTYFGMSKTVGNVSFFDSSGQNEYAFNKPYSDKTAELIDKEVNNLVESAYIRAKDILSENKPGLVELAEILLDKEVIFAEDIERIFGKRKFTEPVKAVSNSKKNLAEKTLNPVSEELDVKSPDEA